jgi:hypothetical protein
MGVERAIALVLSASFGLTTLVLWSLKWPKLMQALLRKSKLRALARFGNTPATKSPVVLVSFSRAEHADKLVEHHHPERVVLIATTQGPAASAPYAKQWQANHGNLDVQIVEISDAFDAAEMQQAASRALQTLLRKYRPDQISADITGGTVAMSIGLFAAAAARRVQVTYMPPLKQDREGRGLVLDDPKTVEVSFTWEESPEAPEASLPPGNSSPGTTQAPNSHADENPPP